jgi:ABC-type dipeptide/oligopeptide/nickel transport system permease component
MFPVVGFFAQQILGIVGSQIEIERIFSLAGIFTNLKRHRL